MEKTVSKLEEKDVEHPDIEKKDKKENNEQKEQKQTKFTQIKMKNKIINSSFYIDGQKLDRFLAAEVDGRDYNLNEFRKAYQLLVENISDYSLEDVAMIVGNDEKWKMKREIKDKVIPPLFLLLLTASYFIILYFLGGVGL